MNTLVTEELHAAINCIVRTNFPYASLAMLRHRIKQAMQTIRTDTADRDEMIHWIVETCETNGRALLTESELSFWWEEPKLSIPLPGPAPLPDGWPR